MTSTYGVVLLGNGSDLSLSVARSLHQAGIAKIHEFAVENGEQLLSKHSRHISTYRLFQPDFDSLDPQKIIEFGRSCEAHILLPVTEEAVMWTGSHHDSLSDYYYLPPLPSTELVQTLRSKLLLHQWLTDHHFPTPRIWKLDQADIVQQLVNEQIAFPLLLKNRSGSVGHDVSRIRDASHLEEVIHSLGPQSSNYLLQEYIEGSDMDCSFMALEGELLAITLQEPVVSRNLRFASSIRFFKQPRFRAFIEYMVRELEWSGVAHLDFRYDAENQTWYLVDFNARYWSTLLGSVCAGINFPYLQVLQALKLPVETNGYQEITFMLIHDALRQLVKQPFGSSAREDFRIKNTELNFSFRDPLPELIRLYAFGRRWLKKLNRTSPAQNTAELSKPSLPDSV